MKKVQNVDIANPSNTKETSSQFKNEASRLVHELEVHQIELEVQNEELRQTRMALESSRNKYVELYDFAPIGYVTLTSNGVIRKINLACAGMLEIERELLTGRTFADLLTDTHEKEIFSNHLALVLKRRVMLRCEIKLNKNDGSVIYGQLQSVAVPANNDDDVILISLVDNTVRKLLEGKLQKIHDKLEQTVLERTRELSTANIQLTQEIEERKKAEASLQGTYTEIKLLKERLQSENIYLQQEVAQQYNFGEIIGKSRNLLQVFDQIEQVAPMNATVLLLGETGTGKGVVARAIHSSSTRKNRPLMTVNCTTLPAALVESELFGRERGAYTGSDTRQIGRFELANGGTIFLDEIGEMPLELQSKLLRVIQDGEFERLGSPRTIKTDVRIIAATNRNLTEEIRNGTFREDLYYRLNVFPIVMPPLRERKEDIPLLVAHFMKKFNTKIGKKITTVPNDVMSSLKEYYWPGNVRELESVIERSIITSRGTSLQVLDRLDTFQKPHEHEGQDTKILVELEQNHILQTLQKTGWRIEGKNGAALILGINPSTLRARMRKFGIARKLQQ